MQVNNSTTLLRGNHAFKAGLDLQWVADTRVVGAGPALHLPERRGLPGGEGRHQPPRLHQLHAVLRPARPGIQHRAVRVLRAGRLARDARTSRCSTACATTSTACPMRDPNAPIATSREFPTSKQQLRAARRRGVDARRATSKTVLRANTGIMYDQTLNAIYEQALQNDGTNARASASFTPTQAGAPAFPAGAQRRRGRDARTWRGRSTPTSRSRGRGRTTCSSSAPSAITTRWRSARSYVNGYNLPVVTNINLINPTGTLARTACRCSARRSTRRPASIRATT